MMRFVVLHVRKQTDKQTKKQTKMIAVSKKDLMTFNQTGLIGSLYKRGFSIESFEFIGWNSQV